MSDIYKSGYLNYLEQIQKNLEDIKALQSKNVEILAKFEDYYTKSESVDKFALKSLLELKQDLLVSGSNIKTINGQTLLGSGNINVGGSYVLPMANARNLGGIKANTKTASEVNEVKIDSNGFLWSKKDVSPYTLPIANATTLGGVKGNNKTADDTQEVHIDSNGFLWTKAGGSSGGGTQLYKHDITITKPSTYAPMPAYKTTIYLTLYLNNSNQLTMEDLSTLITTPITCGGFVYESDLYVIAYLSNNSGGLFVAYFISNEISRSYLNDCEVIDNVTPL